MARNLIPGAPELSRLAGDAPMDLLVEFLGAEEVASAFGAALFSKTSDNHEALQTEILARLRKLPADRLRLIEVQARRVTDLADPVPDELMRRLAAGGHTVTARALDTQRDALARSLWAHRKERRLFANTERAMLTRHYHEIKTLYRRYELDGPVALTAADVDCVRLEAAITDTLKLEEPCGVEALDLPTDADQPRQLMIVVTLPGPFSSQKTLMGRSRRMLFFRPPNEIVLVCTPAEGAIEICAGDPAVRRQVANVFAEKEAGQNVSERPLAWKVYDLSRFRNSLKLQVPEALRGIVREAVIIEVQFSLGSWRQRLSLKVTKDDDIDVIARQVLRSLSAQSCRGWLSLVRFHATYVAQTTGKTRALNFTISGRNSCSLQSERDPDKRHLGHRLLEEWGVLTRYKDLDQKEYSVELPFLLDLNDHLDDEIDGAMLEERGCNVRLLERAGLLEWATTSDVVLLEDEVLGVHEAVVTQAPDDEGGRNRRLHASPIDDVEGAEADAGDLARFRINRRLLEEKVCTTLARLDIRGRPAQLGEHLLHLGAMTQGGKEAPVYLARCLQDDGVVRRVDRDIRLDGSGPGGIVFVAAKKPIEWLGTHVVLSIADLLSETNEQIDPLDVESRYRAARSGAAAGGAVEFRKSSNTLGVLIVPGRQPRTIVGETRTRIVERLVSAHRRDQPDVSTKDLFADMSVGHPSQAFRSDWDELNDAYICSPKRGFWRICT